MAFKKVICKILAILSQPQYVKLKLYEESHLFYVGKEAESLTFPCLVVSMQSRYRDISALHVSAMSGSVGYLVVLQPQKIVGMKNFLLRVLQYHLGAYANKLLWCIWVRSGNCGCLVTWFCYQLIAKPGNKTAAVSWPDPYLPRLECL